MKKITKFISVAVVAVFLGTGIWGCSDGITENNTEDENEVSIPAARYVEQERIIAYQ